MERIVTELTTSISDFKVNPNREVQLAGDRPFAVLTNNRPSFYVFSPAAYEQILEALWQADVTPEILERLNRPDESVEVELKDL